MTIKSENPLPRYASGQKSMTDGKALDGPTAPKQYPRDLSAGDKNTYANEMICYDLKVHGYFYI